MSEDPSDDDPLAELRRRATLREYAFTSGVPLLGGLIARLRTAWNNVATKWQARPFIEQQSAFNHALVDFLERPPDAAALDDQIVKLDRRQTELGGEMARLSARARRADGIRTGRRLRLAYFSPLPPSPSGIADYSAELLPYLAELADVTVFSDDHEANAIDLPLKPTSDYPALRRDFDVPLYQMGNSDRHESMYAMMSRFPGIVVLHDYFLHHFMYFYTMKHADWIGYERDMAYPSGRDGRRLAQAVRDGRAELPLFDEPLNARLIDGAAGLIVHSRYAAERARAGPPGPAVIPAPVTPRPGRSRREQLGVADDALIFGSFGLVTAEKRLDAALRAFRRVHERYPHSRYLLVGGVQRDVDLPGLLAELQLEKAVHHVGQVAELAEFVDWIHTADVVINLRQPTAGETSAVALRALAAGRPVVVYDHGWYAELPDEVALKVPPGDEAALFAALAGLAAEDGRRKAMGEAAAAYVRANHLPQQVARAYVAYINTVLESGPAYA
jgi:glycosyltransferase involved in cell wall biosynthesis